MMFGIDEHFVNQCIEKFNPGEQLDRLIEECAELIKACSKMKREDQHFSVIDPYESLIEEITHVAISSAVVANLYHITNTDINREVEKKRLKYRFERKEQEE